MGYDRQGTVYIPLEEFWKFVKKFHADFDKDGALIRYGNLRLANEDLEIDYAFGTEVPPEDWSEPPEFLKKKI